MEKCLNNLQNSSHSKIFIFKFIVDKCILFLLKIISEIFQNTEKKYTLLFGVNFFLDEIYSLVVLFICKNILINF